MCRPDSIATALLAAHMGAATCIDRPVFEHAEQPRQHRPPRLAAIGVAQHLHEHRLHEVLGGGGVAHEMHRDQQQSRRRDIEHRRERGRVPVALEGAEVAIEGVRVHELGAAAAAAV